MTLNWFKNLKVPSTALAVLLVALVAGCSSSAEQVEVLDRDEIFDRIDQDGDGIALRADYETLRFTLAVTSVSRLSSKV